MKKLLFYSVIAFAIGSSSTVMAQQGIGTNEPDRSAAVDIESTKRGFLMPRIALTSTTVAAPVANPHNALMVYNTASAGAGATAVTPGFYYWSVTAFDPNNPNAAASKHGAGKWVRVVDADDITATSVSEGNGIKVVETENPDGSANYEVRTEAGNATDKYMVTIANPAFIDIATTPDVDQFITTWVDREDFLTELLDVKNGLTLDPDSGELKLGGELTDPLTDINIANTTMVFTLGPTGTLQIKNLKEIDIATLDFTPSSGANEGDSVAIVKADGTVQKISLEDLISQTTYTANNGLTMTGNNVQLGGDLIQDTTITTDENTMTIATDAVGTLAITGLEAADAANKIMVTDATTGVVRTVLRSISDVANNTDLSVDTIAQYSPYVQEVNVAVTLAADDVDVTLPAASAENKGQVVNIRITNTTDAHDGYCNILLPGGGTLTYGAMPYQGWIVKSDGNNWVVVGRN